MLRKSRLGFRLSTTYITQSQCYIPLSKLSTSAVETGEAEGKPSSPSTFTSPRTIFIRPWDALPTMVHVFSIVRDIERRFGKIDDIIVPRDSDIPTNYGPYFVATFAWEEDAQAIPPEGKVIQVPIHNVPAFQPGGVGLSDLEPYLDTEFRKRNLTLKEKNPEEGLSNPDTSSIKLMDVKLERARSHKLPNILEYSLKHRRLNPYNNKNSPKAQDLARAIVSFGGFTNPALPPNAPPSSFARVVESWSNIMTPETRPKLLEKKRTLQPEDPSDPHFHADIEADSTSSPITVDSNSTYDAILESEDELVLIPESTSTMTSRNNTSNIGSSPAPLSTFSEPSVSSLHSRSEPLLNFAAPLPATDSPLSVRPYQVGSETRSTTPIQSLPRSTSQPQASKMSKRERMLLAVRQAGKVDALKNNSQQIDLGQTAETSQSIEGTAPTQGSTAVETASPTGLDDKDQPKGSPNWWGFLLKNNQAKQ